MPVVLETLTHGFFGIRQYAAIAPGELDNEIIKGPGLECSACAIFPEFVVDGFHNGPFPEKELVGERDGNAPFMLPF